MSLHFVGPGPLPRGRFFALGLLAWVTLPAVPLWDFARARETPREKILRLVREMEATLAEAYDAPAMTQVRLDRDRPVTWFLAETQKRAGWLLPGPALGRSTLGPGTATAGLFA